ncbi:AraC family transcriptional regulator [Cephaloticoccus capnophilus]|uniref:AraC family transcriptional regulator n=1 Tax=Cephaloticoccus capnophilus TaxID=1548208 RepID=A0A139SNW2_9BACT|nr:AraC family transcriptional regulator [Cephaloticoccus capnophilus]
MIAQRGTRPSPPNAGSNATALAPLVDIVERATRGVEELSTPIPGLRLFRRNSITQPSYCFIKPSLVLVLQGVKQMVVGTATYVYDTSRFLLTSLEMPARSEVLAASPDAPCLGLNFQLDLHTITELLATGSLPDPRHAAHAQDEKNKDARPASLTQNKELEELRSMGIGEVTPALLDAVSRLLALLDEPAAIPTLAPLIQREIHYRLLTGAATAARLRKITSIDSQAHKIAKAIDWLSENYAAPLSIDALAARVQMSPSSFHQHFRALVAMSPLQYQKRLRLNEARRLMLNEQLDAATAAFEVGYESPSQFSREYARHFGAPPKRDIATLRKHSTSQTS